MSRVNDVGGQEGFGAVSPDPAEAPAFHADWEARVFALNSALLRSGVYNLDEFRDAIERMPPQRYLTASYYERWLTAIETLLHEKGALAEPQPAGVASRQHGEVDSAGQGLGQGHGSGPGRGAVDQ